MLPSAAPVFSRSEHLGGVSLIGVEFVNRAGAAVFAPHAGHPCATLTVKPERGGGGDINIWLLVIVDRNTKNLTNLTRLERKSLRLIQPMLSGRCLGRRPDVEDAANRPFDIDSGAFTASGCPRKSGHESFTRVQCIIVLRVRRPIGEHAEHKPERPNKGDDEGMNAGPRRHFGSVELCAAYVPTSRDV